ncbi:MAG: hypothetical protein GWN93_26940 [Deltaproteobacteria bacterium]|nr:hypothetical protein [Deltaproteobacteria bacterium]
MHNIKLVLSNGKGLYFKNWTDIGPLSTYDVSEAKRYESKEDAMLDATKHYGLYDYDAVECDGMNED